MPRIRRRRGDRSFQNQNQGTEGSYSFTQFLVILLGIFVIIYKLKTILEHERGELRLRASTVQTKGNSLDQTLIDQIVETAAQKVAVKATSQIEQHLSTFSKENVKEKPDDLAVEQGIAETNVENRESSDRAVGSKVWPTNKPRIPNVLVAGVQRGATTSLTKYLVDAHDACSTRTDRLFFAQDTLNAALYASLYSDCTNNMIFVDGSPDTIMYPEEVKKIYEEDGSINDLKIIVTLREPVERELSSYNYRRSQFEESLGGTDLIKKSGDVRDFSDDVRDRLLQDFRQQNVKALYGTYANQLRQWFELFDRKQILILSFAELQRNETAYMDRVDSFLSIDPLKSRMAFPVEAKAEYQQEKTVTLCKFMNFVEFRFFRARNQILQQLMQDNPGPEMEQRPFPQFEVQCTPA